MHATKTRVRFAPSPTGLLHVGNARTALYNWLFARHTGGDFLLRIEDTDLDRSEARHETQLIEDLKWLGLELGRGPRLAGEGSKARTHPTASPSGWQFTANTQRSCSREGKAYRCFCTAEELEAERQKAVAEHRPQVYSGKCRSISTADSEARAAQRTLRCETTNPRPPAALPRYRPRRRRVRQRDSQRSDPVRSSGVPVYNYVVTVDDALMEITHVIRGDDHISNTPKQVAIYEAFGWPVPEFAHLSTILGSDRERLSKRHGATSIASFREMGILPEALVNYLALLGWGAEGGTRETFTLEELTREFKVERVTAAPAVFDWAKLHWLNRHYLKQCEPLRLVSLAAPYFENAGLLSARADAATLAWFEKLVALFLPALDQLDQLPAKSAFVFQFDPDAAHADEENAALLATESTQKVLAAFAARVQHASGPVTADQFKSWMNEIKAETGAKGKDLFHPVRIALTGAHSGPEFDKLIPVIEEGSRLELPLHILSVRERIQQFLAD